MRLVRFRSRSIRDRLTQQPTEGEPGSLGELDKAIADYDASVRLNPNSAWTLYGRGLAKRKRGDADANADIAAAQAIFAQIAESFEKAYGLK